MASESIALKGHKDGYEIIFRSEADFHSVKKELKDLLDHLHNDNSELNAKKIEFKIQTGNRLLTADEKKQIEGIFANYPMFSIHRIQSNVVLKDEALAVVNKNIVHPNADVIRNGQVKLIDGDVLFMGVIHEGGILQATGNIYLLGDVEGIVSAGYPDNNSAVVVGNVKNAQQVRIADVVTIFDDDVQPERDNPVMFINDLHKISYLKMDELKKLRPKIYTKFGGF